MMEVLSPHELKGLKDHKYSASGTTLLDPLMQVYWRWLVERVPLWLAPNAITLIGLLMNIGTTVVIVFYCPDGKQQAPYWAYLLTALGLFSYQSLDAIDGKQARRTNTASPLGELFDHGCDAISCFVVMIGFALALQLGHEPDLFMFMMADSMFMFYAAHWRTYCRGSLNFGLIDVTEAQFGIIAIYIITAVFSPSVWLIQIPYIGMPLKIIPYCMMVIGSMITAYDYFSVVFIQGGVGKHGSTVADTSVLGPVFPIGFVIGAMYYLAHNSASQIYLRHPVLYLLTFAMSFSKITCKLIVAHMSRSAMEHLDSSFVAPLILFINQQLSFLVSEYFLLWVAFIYTSIDLWLYTSRVCLQICNYLDIYCFKIVASKSSAGTSASAAPVAKGSGASASGSTNGTASSSSTVTSRRPVTSSSDADRPVTRSLSRDPLRR